MIYSKEFGQVRHVEVTSMRLPERSRSQQSRELLAQQNYVPEQVVQENDEILSMLPETPFRSIGQKFVKGEQLTFEESFLGMTFVVSATNKAMFQELKPRFKEGHRVNDISQLELRGPAQTFLTAMAQREVHGSLHEEEIAGMVAAGLMDVNLRLKFEPYVLETGGMGGDKGFIVNGEKKKVINASTLSAITLSSLGVPTVKHGSYANTSAVGSTEAIEALGVNIYQKSFAEIAALFEKTRFYFSDAHIAKTIHDLSHSPFMRHETVNHIIGPMTPPISKDTILNKIIGVNEGVHPSQVAKVYEILHKRNYQQVGNVIAISGLSQEFTEDINHNNPREIQPFMMLDELSPYSSLVSIVQNGKFVGSTIVRPFDFGIELDANKIQMINTQEQLLIANTEALKGLNDSNTDYLAMNSAIGLFVAEYLQREDAFVNGQLNRNYLHEAFLRCREALTSQRAVNHLEKILLRSYGKEKEAKSSLLENIDAVIFDIDDTLIKPKSNDFYKNFSVAVNNATAKHFNIPLEQGESIANYFRSHPDYKGGEHALFHNIGSHFPALGDKEPGFGILYDEMAAIDPTGFYESHDHIVEALLKIKERGIKVIGLTDSPEALSRKLLAEAGIDPNAVFDVYIGGSREEGPHKLLRKEEIFKEIVKSLGIAPERFLAIGDSFSKDVQPPLQLGMRTCLIGNIEGLDYSGEVASTIEEVFEKMEIL